MQADFAERVLHYTVMQMIKIFEFPAEMKLVLRLIVLVVRHVSPS